MNSSQLIFCQVDFIPDYQVDLDSIKKFQQLFADRVLYFPAAPTPRAESSINPWNFKLPEQYRIPSLPEKFTLDFAEITDLRAKEILKICEQENLSVVCQWSGGIDSTVILASIIKNFPPYLLDKVHVYMNNASYLENPIFFDKVIKKYGLSYGYYGSDWSQALTILGYPGDPVWGHVDLVELERYHPGAWKNNPITNPDKLLSWMASKSSEKLVKWFYEIVVDSSRHNGVELANYEDFYWWANFNFFYATQCLYGYSIVKENITPDNYKKYCQNIIPWYHSSEYQIWSMVNRSNDVKFDGTIRNYKKAAKDYIFELDKNPYYRDYKTKLVSNKKGNKTIDSVLWALYEDGTAVYKNISY